MNTRHDYFQWVVCLVWIGLASTNTENTAKAASSFPLNELCCLIGDGYIISPHLRFYLRRSNYLLSNVKHHVSIKMKALEKVTIILSLSQGGGGGGELSYLQLSFLVLIIFPAENCHIPKEIP